MNEDVLYAGFQSRFFDFIEDFKKQLDFTALDAARTLNQVPIFQNLKRQISLFYSNCLVAALFCLYQL
jgi:hypothetical protein